MFYSTERFKQFQEAYPDWDSIPVVGSPDFAAEVISPTDGFTEVSRKVARYLADGVRMVWVLERQEKMIQVHLPDSNQIMTYSGNSTISADPIIPGYTVNLAQLFAPPMSS